MKKNTNIVRLLKYRNEQAQWFYPKKEYSIFYTQDIGLNFYFSGFFSPYFKIKKNKFKTLFSNLIVQRTFSFLHIYIPLFFIQDQNILFYFFKNSSVKYRFTPFFKYSRYKKYFFNYKKLYSEKSKKFRKMLFMFFILQKIKFSRKDIYNIGKTSILLPVKIKLLIITYLDYYPRLYSKFIGLHLLLLKNFESFKYKIANLVLKNQKYKKSIRGIFILCSGRLGSNKQLRKQKQWLYYKQCPVMSFKELAYLVKDTTSTIFGIYGISIWTTLTTPSLKKEHFIKKLNIDKIV